MAQPIYLRTQTRVKRVLATRVGGLTPRWTAHPMNWTIAWGYPAVGDDLLPDVRGDGAVRGAHLDRPKQEAAGESPLTSQRPTRLIGRSPARRSGSRPAGCRHLQRASASGALTRTTG